MIKDCIRETELTNEVANGSGAFKVNGSNSSFQCDTSLLAIARAVIEPLVTDHYEIRVRELYRASADDVPSEDDARNSLTVMAVQTTDFEETYREIKEEIEVRGGYEEITRFREYMKKSFDVDGKEAICAYANNDTKSTIVVTGGSIGQSKYHYICSTILSLVPYLRDQGDVVPEEHMDILKAIIGNDTQKFLALIAKEAEKYDFKTAFVRKSLKGFKARSLERRLNNVKEVIEGRRRKLESLMIDIAACSDELRTYQAEENGISLAIGDGAEDESLAEVFVKSKNLELISARGDRVTFDVISPMQSFDAETAERMIANDRSVFYEPEDVSRPRNIYSIEDMRTLMTAIFVDQTLKLMLCARYEMSANGSIHGLSEVLDLKTKYLNSYPNPHIYHYHCLGDYARQITETIKNGDFDMALMQCIASCGSLNVSDSAVMHAMMKDIYIEREGVNLKCVELPDNRIVTFKEAIEYLKEENHE